MGGKTPGPLGGQNAGGDPARRTDGTLGTAHLPNPLGTLANNVHGPKLLLAGQQAMAAVDMILPSAQPITVPSALGPVLLRPGSVWHGNRMLVYAAPLYVWYTIDDRFYEWNTSSFVRDEWLNAMAVGAARARGMVTLAKIEMALLTGIFAPWYLLLGVSCAKLAIFYVSNKQQVDSALTKAPRVLEILQNMRKHHRTLFNKLMKKAANDVIEHLPESVSGEDVAFFLGRVIKGVDAAPAITLGAFAKIVATVGALVAATHLPAVTAHAAEHAAKAHAAELEARLKAAGYTVTRGEAETILRDALSQPSADAMLRELETACKELTPSLDAIAKALTSMD